MNNSELINLLTIVLGVMIGVLVILCFIFLMLKVKTKKPKNKKEKKNNNSDLKSKSTTTVQSYNKESIFKFMEFDKIDDNMIIQKDGKRYLMVIGCQGINYDLMSGLEKNSVEQGFLQFLLHCSCKNKPAFFRRSAQEKRPDTSVSGLCVICSREP